MESAQADGFLSCIHTHREIEPIVLFPRKVVFMIILWLLTQYYLRPIKKPNCLTKELAIFFSFQAGRPACLCSWPFDDSGEKRIKNSDSTIDEIHHRPSPQIHMYSMPFCATSIVAKHM